MRKRTAFLFAMWWSMVLSGCATTETMRPTTTHKPHGQSVAYRYPRKIVFKVAEEAARELGLNVIESAPDKSYFIAERGVTLWSWGELVGIY